MPTFTYYVVPEPGQTRPYGLSSLSYSSGVFTLYLASNDFNCDQSNKKGNLFWTASINLDECITRYTKMNHKKVKLIRQDDSGHADLHKTLYEMHGKDIIDHSHIDHPHLRTTVKKHLKQVTLKVFKGMIKDFKACQAEVSSNDGLIIFNKQIRKDMVAKFKDFLEYDENLLTSNNASFTKMFLDENFFRPHALEMLEHSYCLSRNNIPCGPNNLLTPPRFAERVEPSSVAIASTAIVALAPLMMFGLFCLVNKRKSQKGLTPAFITESSVPTRSNN